MPRTTRSSSTDDDLIRRNPRRGRSTKGSFDDDNDDDDDDAEDSDPMDVDEEESDNDDDDESEDSEELPIRSMANRRRASKNSNDQKSKSSAAASKPSNNSKSNSSSDNNNNNINARRSSRATRFTGGMKEPNPESLRDLFVTSTTTATTNSTARVSRKRSEDNDDSSDDDDDDDDDEGPISRSRRKPQSNTQKTSSASASLTKKKQEPKSPARRHSRARKNAKKGGLSSDESSSEGEEGDYEDDDDDDDDEEDMKIQRILASRTETKAKWREICQKMNSSEVTDGSRWFQEEQIDSSEDYVIEERFLVKWSGLSYLHVSWETQADLLDQTEGAKTYMSTFFRKSINGVLFSADERKDGDYFDPGYVQIDRILAIEYDGGPIPKTVEEEEKSKPSDFGIVTSTKDPDAFETGVGRQILVKWESLNYSEASYEFERDLILADIEYKDVLNTFYVRNKKPTKTELKSRAKVAEEEFRRGYKIFGDKVRKDEDEKDKDVKEYQKKLGDHVYKNGGQLRDYQAEGISWFLSNYLNKRSCILADEMGLGKTLQTAAFCNLIVKQMHRPGPFLIVVPLSTISHWQREFMNWTGLNTIVYHGTADDRNHIRETEFAYPQDRPNSVGANALYLKKCAGYGPGPWMTQVIITTPEILVADDWQELAAVNWEILVVDEAHRLKNHNSKLALNLRKEQFKFKHKILLTGTPIQNDVKEFWTLLNFIDPENFDDIDSFLEQYGEIKSKDRIDELHEKIRPYILRRLKEDVEKSVPPKEETLIEVELTVMQKQYYRALYEKNVGFLHKNKKKALDGPSLNNLAMQLRKCCNHLFLLNGVEEEVKKQQKDESVPEADFLARGSGKLVLLDKLLPRLKENGHRILIFSQFKIMLDILEDYLGLREMKYERIDGSITGQKRQRAIDRFQDETSEDPPFVMLLSTRAGGVGINLTSADTCIIFDSDWNPQNDLQAQARCHRIGQTKNVKVYRLLSRKTYEMQMFHMSSLKMGLDQAVLKGFESNASGEGGMTKEEVERLLRHGAYDIFNEDKAGAAEAESNDFVQQDIDSILERRSRKVTHQNTGSQSNAAGGTFSKASFVAPKNTDKSKEPAEDIDIEDPEFWSKVVGEAPVEVESELKPRQRKKANYSEKFYERQINAQIAGDPDASGSSDSSDDEFSSSDEEGPGELKERSRWGGQQANHWKRNHAESLIKCIERNGYCDSETLANKIPPGLKKFTGGEIHRMEWSIVLLSICEVAKDDAAGAKRRADRQAERKRDEDGGDAPQPAAKAGADESNPYAVATAFAKQWINNKRWVHRALSDAVLYARANAPRSNDPHEGESKEDVVSKLFYQSLWPALQSRGWKEETTETGKVYKYDDYRIPTPNTVMTEVLRIHPELQNMVLPLLRAIEESRLKENMKDEQDRSNDLALNVRNVNFESLYNFLRRYAPLQLIGDRNSSRRLAIGRRVLSSCYYMHSVHTVMAAAALPNTELASLLVVDARSALPHPLWTPKHDAILIQAIAKHGWVDREKSCRAIIEDPDIQWGHPFEESKEPASKDLSEEELAKLRTTAKRAATFMEGNYDMIEQMKGCSRHIIIDSYGLKHESNDSSDPENITWVVDDTMLAQASNASTNSDGLQEAIDLPVKKDMAKRAKTLLQKSMAALEAGRGATGQSSPASKSGDKNSGNNHGYAVIDQGDRCCILLAEMVRGIVKGSTTKMAHNVRKLCALAYEEALALKDCFAGDMKEKAEEMQKIADQIALAKRSLKAAAIPGKNLLRVMLGLEPVPSRTQSESMFPTHAMIDAVISKQKQPTKKDPVRRDDGAAGERAILRAMKKAHDKVKETPCTFNDVDDPDVGLQLTMIETLILFAFCSEGVPLSRMTAPQDDSSLTWDDIGSVLEIAAKDYYQIAKEKLEKARLAMKKLEHVEENVTKTQAASKVAIAEFDETAKEEAAQQAVEYAANPEKLAKKSIMLIEKVRKFGFMGSTTQSKHAHKYENGLGPKVPNWISKELSKLADEFDVSDGTGKPMCFTTTDLLRQNPDVAGTTVAAYLDKKSARQVISQIALLARLRSICLKNSDETLRLKLSKALKASKKVEDVWEKRPTWWDDSSIQHSLLLVQRLNEHGFFNILVDPVGFGPPDQDNTGKNMRDLGLTKAVIQQRVNQLVRELHAQEESEEMIRLLQERRNRKAAQKKQSFDRSLAECHTQKNAPATTKVPAKKTPAKSGGIQTGLRAFFVTTKTNSKKQKVIVLENPGDDSSVGSTGKRKGPASSDEESPMGKRAKKSSSDGSVSSDSDSIDKKFRTVVNSDGVIELVTVRK